MNIIVVCEESQSHGVRMKNEEIKKALECFRCSDYDCENSIFVQERKKTAKEILLPLRSFLIKRFNYFGELAKRNDAISPDNRLFDLGEQDMANCTLDRIKELLEKYGVEIEE